MDLRAAPIEYLLVCVSFVGVVLNAMLLRTTIDAQNLIAADHTSTEPEQIISVSACLQEAIRLGTQMLILVAGCAAISLSPPPPQLRDVPQTIVTISVLIGVSVVMTLKSVLGRLAQREVARAASRHIMRNVEHQRVIEKVVAENTTALAGVVIQKVDTVAETVSKSVGAAAESLERAVAEGTAASKEAVSVANHVNEKLKALGLEQNRLQHVANIIEDEKTR